MKDIILLQEKYEKIYGNEATASGDIENIEEALDVILPFDFKEILSFYSGGLLGGISHFGTSTSDSENIVFVRYSPMSRPNNHKIKIELG